MQTLNSGSLSEAAQGAAELVSTASGSWNMTGERTLGLLVPLGRAVRAACWEQKPNGLGGHLAAGYTSLFDPQLVTSLNLMGGPERH